MVRRDERPKEECMEEEGGVRRRDEKRKKVKVMIKGDEWQEEEDMAGE